MLADFRAPHIFSCALVFLCLRYKNLVWEPHRPHEQMTRIKDCEGDHGLRRVYGMCFFRFRFVVRMCVGAVCVPPLQDSERL